MYTKEQIEIALKEYERLGSVQAVINLLEYPSSSTLYRWYERKLAKKTNYHVSLDKPYIIKKKIINAPNHPRIPDTSLKLEAIKRCFSLGEGVEYVSRNIGYSRVSIYSWYRKYKKFGVAGLMINMIKLKNHEKVVVIDAVEDKYPLHQRLKCLCMAKSSYYYQKSVMKRPDKYAKIRVQIKMIFQKNRNCYGYRRIYEELKKIGVTVSEKIVRRIMKEENLTVPIKRIKKYSSYKGEITPEVDNIINRDFHAERPNTKWLTDITEFAIPAGKVYLSPIIDCFDGMVVKWNIRTTPDSILVNKMLEDAISTLSPYEHPLVHTDRGFHYRWSGWIKQMRVAGLTRSMSKKGCSPDNAACEGFFGRLKNEMFYGRSWIGVTMDDFINELNSYIDWYNTKRIKKSLGYMSPVEYRHSLGLSA